MARGIMRQLAVVERAVSKMIQDDYAAGSAYFAAVAGEGYNGGYRDALDDVRLALNGVTPDRWQKWTEGLH